MDVDLTEQLKEAKIKYDRRVQEAAEAAAAATARGEADVTPSQGEVRRWQRSGRYSRKVSNCNAFQGKCWRHTDTHCMAHTDACSHTMPCNCFRVCWKH